MPQLDSGLFTAFQAKDARFDGRFFVGISTTGIYCRPICRAKLPKKEHCAFYATAAEAEQAGYRPCLLCRPELAPGVDHGCAARDLVHRAARAMEQGDLDGHTLSELSRRLGCTDRHLRRSFAAEYHVSPIQYLQTCRLLLAKSLLTDTDLPVLDVAMAAGFGSLRRFNGLFKQRYRLSPTALRKRKPRTADADAVTLSLAYRPPYRWDAMLRFLEQRAIAGVERVENGAYRRAVRLHSVSGWLSVTDAPEQFALQVTVSASLLSALPQVLARVRRMFDLDSDPDTIDALLASMGEVQPGLPVPGMRLPGCFDAFEMAARAVLGQQITVKAARTLASRLVDAYGTPIDTPISGLTHTFPPPAILLALEGPIESRLGPLGIISTRAQTLLALASALQSQTIELDLCPNPEAEMKKLMSIRGIGNWTAQYIAMRAMAWPDAFLETDAGIKKALTPRTAKEMLALSVCWRPWRSYAMMNLWYSLEGGEKA